MYIVKLCVCEHNYQPSFLNLCIVSFCCSAFEAYAIRCSSCISTALDPKLLASHCVVTSLIIL